MTRLYTFIKSDRRRNDIMLAANEKIEILVHYGSASSSQLYGKVVISWHPEDKEPSVDIYKSTEDGWRT